MSRDKIEVSAGKALNKQLVGNYFEKLVSSFFKILPMSENGESSINAYMKNLQFEIIGCEKLIGHAADDGSIMSLISILENLIDSDCDILEIRRQVFKSIAICKNLKKWYAEDVDGPMGSV